MKDWKAGDLARIYVTTRDRWHKAVYTGESPHPWRLLDGWGPLDPIGPGVVREARPLVVLDPDDMDLPQMAPTWLRAQAQEIDLRSAGTSGSSVSRQMRWLADQIEAQIQPPKPDEPTGLGAVVEDAAGKPWIRVGGPELGNLAWATRGNVGYVSGWRSYADVSAVRVLSVGVQP